MHKHKNIIKNKRTFLIKIILSFIFLGIIVILISNIFSTLSLTSKAQLTQMNITHQIETQKLQNEKLSQQLTPLNDQNAKLKSENIELNTTRFQKMEQNKQLKKDLLYLKDEIIKELQRSISSKEEQLKQQHKSTSMIGNNKQLYNELNAQYQQLNIQYLDMTKRPSQTNSNIILTYKEYNYLALLISWGELRFNLLYSTRIHGWDVKEFHNKCDDSYYTMTVVQLKSGLIIIGFVSDMNHWSGEGYKTCKYARLVNLHARKDYVISKPNYAVYADPQSFPSFGEGDFVITKGKATSKFPSSYAVDTAGTLELTEGIAVDTIEEMEVFSVEIGD